MSILVCLMDCSRSLQRQCFRQVRILAVIFFETGNIPDAISRFFRITGEVPAPSEVGWSPGSMAGDVHVKTEIFWICTTASVCPQMGFSGMNRPIATLLQQCGKGHISRLEAVDVPLRRHGSFPGASRVLILAKNPIGDAIRLRRSPRHDAGAGRCTHRR